MRAYTLLNQLSLTMLDECRVIMLIAQEMVRQFDIDSWVYTAEAPLFMTRTKYLLQTPSKEPIRHSITY